MLQPSNRLTLIEAMRPPTGFAFDTAMAVTFTLDLRALLAAPAAFALVRDVDLGDDPPNLEPIDLLHAIRANADRITIFAQAGEIALPQARRIFAFLEGSVVSVTAPRGGVVHPKVWVLRYVDPNGVEPRQLRVLISSRNLTFDTSWDTVLRLDSAEPGVDGTQIDPIADLFDALVTRSVGTLADEHARRVASLGADLRQRRFALPSGVDGLAVHVLGLGASRAPFPDHADRSLVVAPFVSDDFFARVHPDPVDELVSRPEHLDALAPSTRDRVRSMFAFDDGSNPDFEDDTDRAAAHDPARPLRGLHAKLFAFEVGTSARLFCGSANATGAAFGSNVEVLVELTGSTKRLGIDALCSGTEDEVGLRSLFIPFILGDATVQDHDGHLDGVRRSIGGLDITGVVEPSRGDWAVTYTSTGAIRVPEGIAVACWPLLSGGNRRPVAAGESLAVRFETSLEGISGFLVFEAKDSTGTTTHAVVPVPLENLPDERDRQLLRALVGSGDRFLRYLLALLADGSDQLTLLEVVDSVANGQTSDPQRVGSQGLPVLEQLIRTLRTDPARLAALDPLVTDLARDDALPPGFLELWRSLRAAGFRGDT